jgi:hypothetical protein
MDEAIAELYSVFYCITSLRLEETMQEARIDTGTLTDSLKKQLYKAYQLFVKKVLHEEISTKPLGILRPGILQIMKSLQILQQSKKVAKVIIYSNNGNLQCVEFIRDVIHEYLGTPLIAECVHRFHPLREESTIRYQRSNGGLEKTWNNLRHVLIQGKAKAPSTLKPSDVYFFDDLDHRDLHNGLGSHYYQVPPYQFKASFERIGKLYEASITESKVSMVEFLSHITNLYGYHNRANSPMSSIHHVIKLFTTTTEHTAKQEELPPSYQYDKGINMMKEAIERIKNKGKKVRKYTKKINRGISKKRWQQL